MPRPRWATRREAPRWCASRSGRWSATRTWLESRMRRPPAHRCPAAAALREFPLRRAAAHGRLAPMPQAIDRVVLDELFGVLERRGYTLVGPLVRDRAIVLDELETTADLPAGWTDVQDGGSYRLERREDDALFGHNAGPNSWKSYLFPSELRIWTARQSAEGLEVTEDDDPPPRYAFIGARSCDLHAMAAQDRVFMEGGYVDQDYRARREGAFIVAVNCGQAAATCFCVSMDTGPKAASGFDLALTE